MTERELRADPSPESLARLAGRIRERYDIELANHFAIEELILFPAYPCPLVDQLIGEHRRFEQMVAELAGEPSADVLSSFAQLMRTHIRREENELFPAMQRDLTRAELDALGAEIEQKVVRVRL